MMYCIKFKDLEERENFREACELLGWTLHYLSGSEKGWALETQETESDGRMVGYLHNLGAFKFENEN